MAKNTNVSIFSGNLVRDPEVRAVQVGGESRSVASFTVAVNGFKEGQTAYVDCDAWGKLADVIGAHLGKGKKVNVTGSLKTESWEKDGAKRSKLKVVAQDVEFLSPKTEETNDHDDSDVPF